MCAWARVQPSNSGGIHDKLRNAFIGRPRRL
jgi:hypothetical protein